MTIKNVEPTPPDEATLAVISAAVGDWVRLHADEIEEQVRVRAVIAAVVASLFGREARIRRIMEVAPQMSSRWARAGRDTHLRSHTLHGRAPASGKQNT